MWQNANLLRRSWSSCSVVPLLTHRNTQLSNLFLDSTQQNNAKPTRGEEEVELLAYGLVRAIARGKALVWPVLLCVDFPLPLFYFEGALRSSCSAHSAAYHGVRNEKLHIILKFQH